MNDANITQQSTQRPFVLITAHNDNDPDGSNFWNHQILLAKLRSAGVSFKQIHAYERPDGKIKQCALVDYQDTELAKTLAKEFGQANLFVSDSRRVVSKVFLDEKRPADVKGTLKAIPYDLIRTTERFLHDPKHGQYFVIR